MDSRLGLGMDIVTSSAKKTSSNFVMCVCVFVWFDWRRLFSLSYCKIIRLLNLFANLLIKRAQFGHDDVTLSQNSWHTKALFSNLYIIGYTLYSISIFPPGRYSHGPYPSLCWFYRPSFAHVVFLSVCIRFVLISLYALAYTFYFAIFGWHSFRFATHFLLYRTIIFPITEHLSAYTPSV